MGRSKFSLVALTILGALLSAAVPTPADILITQGGIVYATVTLTPDAANPANTDVTVTATSGNSLKAQDGADVGFNPTIAVTGITDLLGNPGTVTADFLGSPNINDVTFTQDSGGGAGSTGTFGIELTKIGTGQTSMQGITSVNSYDFIVLGATVAQLEGMNSLGNTFEAHICPQGGTNCGGATFFAAGQTPTTSVPEPMSAALLGSGLVGVWRRGKSLWSRKAKRPALEAV